MKCFVTGGTGFLGGEIVCQLRQAGHDVTALVRSGADAHRLARLQSLGCRLHAGDVTDRASLRQGMAGADALFHVAGWYKIGVWDDAEAVRINVTGTRQVLKTMQELAIPRGVYTSTLAVHSDTRGRLVDESYRFLGRHLTIYDRTKWQAHYEVAQPLIERGLPLCIVLPGVIYGPGDRSRIADMFVRYLAGKLPAIPAATAYCWAHVADIAAGHIAALARGQAGESYHLAGPAHTLAEALETAREITGVPLASRRIPRWLMRGAAAATRWLGRVAPLPADLHHEVLLASGGVTYLGTDHKARTALGFCPRPLAVGLRQLLAEMHPAAGLPSA